MTGLAGALAAADAAADRFLASHHLPGVVYGVVIDGELVHERGIGTIRVGETAVPDADSVFRIASMTKSFTAATVVALRDEGRLALDDPIAAHVPELAGLRPPTKDSSPITVRHLLTMSAGLGTDDPWGDRQQGLDLAAFAELLEGPLTFAWPPGTRFEYSNLGYGILGRLITNVTGVEYRDVVRERILEPLGMSSSGYLAGEVPRERLARGYLWRDGAHVEQPVDGYGALASMGGLFSSVRDLARWVAFFAGAFPPRDDPDDARPLSRASRREMQQVHRALGAEVRFPSLDADPDVTAAGYGFGLFIDDHLRWGRIVGHGGGYPGFGSNMAWHVPSGLGIVALANHRYAPCSRLARELMTTLLGADAVPVRRIRPASATAAARTDVERLLAAWDDELAANLFAMNVELDEPIERRRVAMERIREVHGALRLDPELPEESASPLHVSWWLAGERGGRVRVEVLLSPEGRPRVQALALTSVPAPSGALAAVAEAVVASVNGPNPGLPPGLALGPAVDGAALARLVRIAGARFAPLAVGPVVAGDGTGTATWRLTGGRGVLELAIELEPGTGAVVSLGLVQPPPVAPPHDN